MNNYTPVSFGERLKEIRNSRNLSQEELAQILDTSKQVISRYENGQRTPKITTVSHYANILGVSLEYLIGIENKDVRSIEKAVQGGNARKTEELLELPLGSILSINNSSCTKSSERKPMRSVARLENNEFTPDEDRQIDNFIDFLLKQRSENNDK